MYQTTISTRASDKANNIITLRSQYLILPSQKRKGQVLKSKDPVQKNKDPAKTLRGEEGDKSCFVYCDIIIVLRRKKKNVSNSLFAFYQIKGITATPSHCFNCSAQLRLQRNLFICDEIPNMGVREGGISFWKLPSIFSFQILCLW